MIRVLLLVALLTVLPCAAHAQGGVLIVAPHPDDEVIGCAGVMMRALAEKKPVTVVVLTHGDGYPALAAAVAGKPREQLTPADFLQSGAVRQGHSVQAMKRLGLPRGDLLFLGYPDGGLEPMWRDDSGTAFRHTLTQKSETYGVAARDYHSLVHGRPAPFLKSSLTGDLAEIVRARRPDEVFVTHESDTHADHRCAFWFASEALREAKFAGRLLSFVVHGKPWPRDSDRRVRLTPHEYETKRLAITDHTQGTSPVHDGLVRAYLKPEESFWAFPVLHR